MKFIFTKKFRFGGNSAMISGGWGRNGLYIFVGILTKIGLSIGASIGTLGRQIYGSLNRRNGQLRLTYNLDSKKTSPRTRYYGKSPLGKFFDSIFKLLEGGI